MHGGQAAAGGGAGGGGRAGRGGRQERAGLHQVRAEAAVSARPGAVGEDYTTLISTKLSATFTIISTIISTLLYPGRNLVQHGQPQPHHLPLPAHLHRAGRGLDLHQVLLIYRCKYLLFSSAVL